MDFNSIINDVNSKEDFMNFLTQLRLDKQQKSEEWENDEITSYLEGVMQLVDRKIHRQTGHTGGFSIWEPGN